MFRDSQTPSGMVWNFWKHSGMVGDRRGRSGTVRDKISINIIDTTTIKASLNSLTKEQALL